MPWLVYGYLERWRGAALEGGAGVNSGVVAPAGLSKIIFMYSSYTPCHSSQKLHILICKNMTFLSIEVIKKIATTN